MVNGLIEALSALVERIAVSAAEDIGLRAQLRQLALAVLEATTESSADDVESAQPTPRDHIPAARHGCYHAACGRASPP